MLQTYETDLNDIPVTVEYEYEPAEGDGWHNPHFAEQIMVHEVKTEAGMVLDIDLDEAQTLEDEIIEALHQDAIDRSADEADYRYHCWKDRNI